MTPQFAAIIMPSNSSGSDTVSRTVPVATMADILPGERVYDWSYASVPGGIPSRASIIRTLATSNTVTEINAAIASCPSGQAV